MARLTNSAIAAIGWTPICLAAWTIKGATTAPQSPSPYISPIAVDWIDVENASVYKQPIKQLALTTLIIKNITGKNSRDPN